VQRKVDIRQLIDSETLIKQVQSLCERERQVKRKSPQKSTSSAQRSDRPQTMGVVSYKDLKLSKACETERQGALD